ncbi:MinD/ParA family protein [Nanoarchaeota archaeon]
MNDFLGNGGNLEAFDDATTAMIDTRRTEYRGKSKKELFQLGRNPKIIAVQGLKGGTGKTTIGTAFAYFLARRKGKKICYLDLDTTGPNAQTLFGFKEEEVFTETGKNLYSFLQSGDDNLMNFLQPVKVDQYVNSRIDFLAAQPFMDRSANLNTRDSELLVQGIQNTIDNYDFVVLETGGDAYDSTLIMRLLGGANSFIVIDGSPHSVGNTMELIRHAFRKDLEFDSGALTGRLKKVLSGNSNDLPYFVDGLYFANRLDGIAYETDGNQGEEMQIRMESLMDEISKHKDLYDAKIEKLEKRINVDEKEKTFVLDNYDKYQKMCLGINDYIVNVIKASEHKEDKMGYMREQLYDLKNKIEKQGKSVDKRIIDTINKSVCYKDGKNNVLKLLTKAGYDRHDALEVTNIFDKLVPQEEYKIIVNKSSEGVAKKRIQEIRRLNNYYNGFENGKVVAPTVKLIGYVEEDKIVRESEESKKPFIAQQYSGWGKLFGAKIGHTTFQRTIGNMVGEVLNSIGE